MRVSQLRTFNSRGNSFFIKGKTVRKEHTMLHQKKTQYLFLFLSFLFSFNVLIAGNYHDREKRRWPLGIVPFEIDPAFNDGQKRTIEQAVRHWNVNTHFYFYECEGNDCRNDDFIRQCVGHNDRVIFTPARESCSSPIVRRRANPGGQDISCAVGNGFGFGSVVHEMGHAVGLFHEQTRPDRDHFVTINWDNIRKPIKHNFKISRRARAYGIYDFDSIMHYPLSIFSFAKDPNEDVIYVNPWIEYSLWNIFWTGDLDNIGQRDGLSVGDIEVANFLSGRTSSPVFEFEKYVIDGEWDVLSRGWRAAEVMANHGGHLYIVRAGQLYRVKHISGRESCVGSGWSGTDAMTAHGDNLYLVQGGHLYQVDPEDGGI